LYGLLGLHVLAIAFYTVVRKEQLVRPMVTGWKEVPGHLQAPRRAGPLALLAAVLLALAAVYAAKGSWATGQPWPFAASSAASGGESGADRADSSSPSAESTAPAAAPAPSW